MDQELIPGYRLSEASRLSGYSVAALRKKILRRELGYRRTGRIITIPRNQVIQLQGTYHPPVQAGIREAS